MAWIELVTNLAGDYTFRVVVLGMIVLGVASGALGAFALLRRQSLLGDAISHAALPGVVLAFLLTGSKQPLALAIGAGAAGWLATVWMMQIIRHTRIKEDAALGLVLSVFFGLGLMLLTFSQRLPNARQAGLDHFLFGQAAALLAGDVLWMAFLAGLILAVLGLLWKEFKLLSFDREFGASLGMPVGFLDVVLITLMTAVIVLGLQAVGVVLMSALLIAPAAAARQWTDRLGNMVYLSAFFGALAGVAGSLISSLGYGLSTGPVIVLCASFIVVISLLFAPNRGLIWNLYRQYRNRKNLRTGSVLVDLLSLASQHDEMTHPHSIGVLQAMNVNSASVVGSLHELARRGLVESVDNVHWNLTSRGLDEARRQTRAGGQE